MKNILFSLFFILPLITFGQLGKTQKEIKQTLGNEYVVDFVDRFTNYIYDFKFLYEDKWMTERYIFTFERVNGDMYCTNWQIVRPIETYNQTYWELEDYFKLNDTIYIGEIDKTKMNINLFRGEGYYCINVTYKNEYKLN